MVRDAETGEMLCDAELWEIGYAVGLLLRPRESVYAGLHRDELLTRDIDTLLAGYSAGVRETEAELKQRAEREQAAPLPVCDDEIPF